MQEDLLPSSSYSSFNNKEVYSPNIFDIPQVLWNEIFGLLYFQNNSIPRTFSSLRLVCKTFRNLIAPYWKQKIKIEDLEVYASKCLSFGFSVHSLTIIGSGLGGKPIFGKMPPTFAEAFPNLQELVAHKTIKTKDLLYLPQSILYLRLSYCKHVKNKGFQFLPSRIERLDLSLNTHLVNSSLEYLPASIKVLDLSYCSLIGDEGLIYLSNLLKLEELVLTNNSNVSDEGISYLPRTLQYLNIAYCINVTDQGLQYLPPTLRMLNLSGNNKISVVGLQFLPKSLKEVKCNNCNKISYEGMKYIKENFT